jgi:hypothetical protein
MKKNILSLVAFMAFSVSAFANTVEVKEEVVEVKEEVEVVAIDCYEFAAAVEAIFAPEGGRGGYVWFQFAYDRCVSGGHCTNCQDEIVVTN